MNVPHATKLIGKK